LNGGGILIYSDGIVTIKNTILWNNAASTGKQIYVDNEDGYSTLTINYSDLEGGESPLYVPPGCTINWGPGMIYGDPLFEQGSMGPYCLSQQAAGQTLDSPCVDAGDPGSEMIDGTTRTDSIQDAGIVDMGYHYPVEIFTCSVECLTPVVHPGENVEFSISIENLTGYDQKADAATNIYLCDGTFFRQDLHYSMIPFSPYQIRTATRALPVPDTVPPGVTYCDLKYELVVIHETTGLEACRKSCYFQIQDAASAEPQGE